MDKIFKDIHIINKKTNKEVYVLREINSIWIQDASIHAITGFHEVVIPLIDIEKVNILID